FLGFRRQHCYSRPMMVKRRIRAIHSVPLFVLAIGVVISACEETRAGLGQDCLKSADCLSNICDGLHCVAAPPICDDLDSGCFDAAPPVVDGSADGGDGGDGGEAGPSDAAVDAGG